ncbi:sodium:solute symporter [Desulfomarina profundi]|uniref:Sodium:solute symporter n=1 Tax=Desulfomarina profundi TaxID=2772557 RepID=A0A8D5FU74_9BACT|nr:sodium:solute symporter family protein [Desulfomarina profundi]BCL61779.1 sodium:solute symporter [Desulfomarina profundi]
MYQLTFIITFIIISLLTVRRGTKVKSAADFSIARGSLPFTRVSWIIIGTLVGGVSTIGTVQTAYTHGIAACIFTFGSGISCFLLGCLFAKALREEGVITVSEFLGKYFGEKFRHYSSILNSSGMFLHVVGQFLASIAILQSVFRFGPVVSILLTLILLGVFVISGGISGAGLIGQIKFFMLYMIMLVCAGLALYKGGGLNEIISRLPQDLDMLSFAAYGRKTAAIDMLSMLAGVLSTQIYLQAIFSAKNVKEARNGAFLSATVIPPIGVLGLIVGLYLRGSFPEIGEHAAQALPFFIYHSFPPVIAAFFSAGILLIVLGTGAGLTLGVTTNIYNDFLCTHKGLLQKNNPVRLLRITALAVLILATILVFTGLDTTILKWSYLSMGLRGSAVFAGLFVAVFFKKNHQSRFILLSLYLIPIIYIVLSLV